MSISVEQKSSVGPKGEGFWKKQKAAILEPGYCHDRQHPALWRLSFMLILL
jgi:hypothetical protein